jgi:hypothetical protein
MAFAQIRHLANARTPRRFCTCGTSARTATLSRLRCCRWLCRCQPGKFLPLGDISHDPGLSIPLPATIWRRTLVGTRCASTADMRLAGQALRRGTPRTSLLRCVVVALVAIAWLPGCAPLRVNTYATPVTDLRVHRTYAWDTAELESTGDPRLDHNRFFQDRVQRAVDPQMSFRGYEKMGGEMPDLMLHIHARVRQRVESAQPEGPGGSCRQEECRPYVYDEGTLFIDITDTRTKTLIWRGWAETSLDGIVDNQDLMNQVIDRAVRSIFARLPVRRFWDERPS